MVLRIFLQYILHSLFFKEFWFDSIYHLGYTTKFFNTLTIVKFQTKFSCRYFEWSIYKKSLKNIQGVVAICFQNSWFTLKNKQFLANISYFIQFLCEFDMNSSLSTLDILGHCF